MSCNIISASHASINGSSDAYGGYIVSASYMPSTINGYNKASVVLAGANSTPAGNDEASIGIAGLELNMRVGSITESTRAGSVSTTTIHYYDNSQILDNTHVLLKEEVAEGLGAIGDKIGPRPDIQALNSLGLIVPASDTVFVKLREFYAGIEAAGFNVDDIITSAPGKTIYDTEQFMDAFGEILGDSFSIPDGAKMDFQGPLRQVIGQMCNTFGMVAYWDPETDTVVTSAIGATNSTASSNNNCTIIGSSTTSDYTASRAQGAHGTFSTSNDGESQSSSGGNMSRYFLATLLEPTLKMRVNACGGEKIELNFFDKDGNVDEDIAKAMSAAQDSKVYSMYALQSALSDGANGGELPEISEQLYGQGNAQNQTKFNLNDMIPVQYPQANAFLRDYYKCQLEDVHLLDAPGKDYDGIGKLFANQSDAWNSDIGSSPRSKVGRFNDGKFTGGHFLFSKKSTKSSIFGEGLSLTGEGDILRKFLNIIPNFINQLWVLKSANAARSAQTSARNYGYYITSNATVGGQNPRFGDGFDEIPLNPWAPLSDCGNQFIQDLAMVLFAMSGTQGTCGPHPLSEFTVIDFVYALEKDKLEALFSGNTTEAQEDSSQQAADLFDQGHTMYLGTKKGVGVSPPDLGPTTVTCFDQAEISEISIPSDVVVATEKIGSIGFKGGSGAQKTAMEDFGELYDMGVLSSLHPIHTQIEPIELVTSPPRSKIYLWFNVEGNSSSLTSGPGQAFIGGGSLPPEGAWKSTMTTVSVNSADIAAANGINQNYLADTYDEGFTYSRQNLGIMADALADKINEATWVDDAVGESTSTTYLLIDDEMPDIPSVGEGLDSLNITTAGGKTELTVTVGNANYIRARTTLRDLKAENSHLQHSHSLMLPNVLNSAPNTKIQSIANGNL